MNTLTIEAPRRTAHEEPLPTEPVADEDREPDPEEPEDADDAMPQGDDPRIAEAEWQRHHATNDDAPTGWGL